MFIIEKKAPVKPEEPKYIPVVNKAFVNFRCKECDFETLYKRDLKKHELTEHSTDSYKCGECDFVTQHRASIISHEFRHKATKLKRGKIFETFETHGGGFNQLKKAKIQKQREEEEVTVKCEIEEVQSVQVFENDFDSAVKIEKVDSQQFTTELIE